MNKSVKHIACLVLLLATIMVSCEKNIDKKNAINLGEYESDYGELAEKYAEMKFENCDEAILAGNEIATVLYSTSNKAFNENDAKAKSDLEHFEELINDYDAAIEPLWKKCPDEFDKWNNDNRKKIDSILRKLNAMQNPHDTIGIHSEDVSSEIEAVNEQVEQLMIDIQRFSEEDDSLNNKQ